MRTLRAKEWECYSSHLASLRLPAKASQVGWCLQDTEQGAALFTACLLFNHVGCCSPWLRDTELFFSFSESYIKLHSWICFRLMLLGSVSRHPFLSANSLQPVASSPDPLRHVLKSCCIPWMPWDGADLVWPGAWTPQGLLSPCCSMRMGREQAVSEHSTRGHALIPPSF